MALSSITVGVTPTGCCGLNRRNKYIIADRCFRVAHLASTHDCRMRRKRLSGLRFRHRFVGLIRRVSVDQAMVLGCRMRRKRLIRPTVRHRFVDLIRRVSVASGNGARCRMQRKRLIRPTVQAQVCRLIRRVSVASGNGARMPDAA